MGNNNKCKIAPPPPHLNNLSNAMVRPLVFKLQDLLSMSHLKIIKSLPYFCGKLSLIFLLTFYHPFPFCFLINNRPLARRGLVTNASFKQWVGILLMPKIDRAHKNYLTPKIWEEKHLRGTFYGTLIFQQSSMICIGRHIGGHTLALQHGGQNYFLLTSCLTFDSYTQMCSKHYHIIFSTHSLKFKCNICVQKEVKLFVIFKITFWSRDQLPTYSF